MIRMTENAVAELRNGFYLMHINARGKARTLPLSEDETERFIREILGRDDQ